MSLSKVWKQRTEQASRCSGTEAVKRALGKLNTLIDKLSDGHWIIFDYVDINDNVRHSVNDKGICACQINMYTVAKILCHQVPPYNLSCDACRQIRAEFEYAT